MDGGGYERRDSNKEDDTCQSSQSCTCTAPSSTALPLPAMGDEEIPMPTTRVTPRALHPLGSKLGNLHLKVLILPLLKPWDINLL